MVKNPPAKSRSPSKLFKLRLEKRKGSVIGDCLSSVDCLLESSNWHVSGENMEKGTCRLLPCRKAEEDGVRSRKYIFGPRTVLYSKIRPYLRKAVLVDFRGLYSADIYPLKVIS
jgi:hypothetical protein